METTLQPYSDNKLDFGSSMNYCGEMAMVGLDAMQRANSTLEDFVSVWFKFFLFVECKKIDIVCHIDATNI